MKDKVWGQSGLTESEIAGAQLVGVGTFGYNLTNVLLETNRFTIYCAVFCTAMSFGKTQPRKSERQDQDLVFWLSSLVIVLVVLYVATYFWSVGPGKRGWGVAFSPDGRTLTVIPDYHGLPPKLFAPLHNLDRKLLRPSLWRFSGRVWTINQGNGQSTNFWTNR